MYALGTINIIRCLSGVAAGTSEQAGSAVDMFGWDGVVFIAAFGTLTSTQVTGLKVQQSSDNGVSDAYADISGGAVGPLADADSGKLLVLDVYKPKERYLKPVVTRGTADAVIDGVIAIQYRGSQIPTELSASVVDSLSV